MLSWGKLKNLATHLKIPDIQQLDQFVMVDIYNDFSSSLEVGPSQRVFLKTDDEFTPETKTESMVVEEQVRKQWNESQITEDDH